MARNREKGAKIAQQGEEEEERYGERQRLG
jgi:hypothetical protein